MEITKLKINGRKLYIIDNVLNHNKIHDIYAACVSSEYTMKQLSDGLHHVPNLRMSHHIETADEIDYIFKDLFKAQKKILKYFNLWKKVETADVYINMADALTTMLPHADRPEGNWTLLYYANKNWDKTYSGATNFFNEHDDEIAFSCLPKPGRFVLFPADILHQALPPTHFCPYKRFTIAFKMDTLPKLKPKEKSDYNCEEFETETREVIHATNTCW